MPLIKYKRVVFNDERELIVRHSIRLLKQYTDAGYRPTLRQLYYRFVALDLFPDRWADKETGSKNNDRSYAKLKEIMVDARMAGRVDWLAMDDITRILRGNQHWAGPVDALSDRARKFRLDRWVESEHRLEVWVEKDAMIGPVARAAMEKDVDYFSCRGYGSATALWEAGQRLKSYCQCGQTPMVFHLGDHDPSGLDMSRDIQERVRMFMDGYGGDLEFERLALNIDQIRRYNPPPSPAKVTDSRYQGYIAKFGKYCWELDSLEPEVIHKIILDAIDPYVDTKKWQASEREEGILRTDMVDVAHHWQGDVMKAITKIREKIREDAKRKKARRNSTKKENGNGRRKKRP